MFGMCLTFQHIMVDIVDFALNEVVFFFDVRSMKALFNSVTPSTILLYVRAIRHSNKT